jgi:hypothetical protein
MHSHEVLRRDQVVVEEQQHVGAGSQCARVARRGGTTAPGRDAAQPQAGRGLERLGDAVCRVVDQHDLERRCARMLSRQPGQRTRHAVGAMRDQHDGDDGRALHRVLATPDRRRHRGRSRDGSRRLALDFLETLCASERPRPLQPAPQVGPRKADVARRHPAQQPAPDGPRVLAHQPRPDPQRAQLALLQQELRRDRRQPDPVPVDRLAQRRRIGAVQVVSEDARVVGDAPSGGKHLEERVQVAARAGRRARIELGREHLPRLRQKGPPQDHVGAGAGAGRVGRGQHGPVELSSQQAAVEARGFLEAHPAGRVEPQRESRSGYGGGVLVVEQLVEGGKPRRRRQAVVVRERDQLA